MITVLHSLNTRDTGFFQECGSICNLADVRELYNNGGYEFVAIIDTNDMDEAWEASNNITSQWTKGKKVNTLSKDAQHMGYARSSMVGDIFGDEDDNYYVVAGAGFIKLGKLPHPATSGLNTTETGRG